MSQPEPRCRAVYSETDGSECRVEVEPSDANALGVAADVAPDVLIDALLGLLHRQTRIDFRPYRRSMMVQRVLRRMRLINLQAMGSYLKRCQADTLEVETLGKELLSGSTRFFRDPAAFEYLGEKVIPELLQKVGTAGPLRVWVAGCGTGEEAYSIAMLLREQADRIGSGLDVKVFATDIDSESLAVAGRGLYAEDPLMDVSSARLQRFFSRRGDHYQVAESLRETLIFAPHNLLEDPPLTKMDLVVCRNVLGYIDGSFHTQVLTPLQFALQPGGILFLGPRENPGELASLFQPLDMTWRIYQKIENLQMLRPVWSRNEPTSLPLRQTSVSGAPKPARHQKKLLDHAFDHLMETYCPPTLLVNHQLDVLRIIGDMAPYLKQLSGSPSLSVLQLLHDDLCLPVRTLIQRLGREPDDINYRHVPVRLPEGRRYVTIQGRRQSDCGVSLMVLSFEAAVSVDHDVSAASVENAKIIDGQERIEALEQMLRHTQETLQSTIEELETSNVALKNGNEDMLASNEALLATNEELQAMNEELYTVNGEYQNKIVELTRLTDDMDNLLRSTDIGTIFLDTELCIRQFTPAIAASFHLLPQDIGRPIDHMTPQLEDDQLLADAAEVLRAGEPMVQEVRNRQGQWMLRRLNPYRTDQGACEGVILTLVDISALKTAEAKLQQSEKRFRDLIEESDQGILIYRSGRPLFVNRACAQLFGYSVPEDMLALDDIVADMAAPHEYARLWHFTQGLLEHGNAPMHYEFQGLRQDGKMIWVENAMRCVMWEGEYAVQSTMVDITERKQAEEALARKTLELQRSNDDLEQFAYVASHDLQEPLRMVRSYLKLLQDRYHDKLGTDGEQFIAFGVDGAERMQQLIRDLLAYARLGQQDLVLKSISCDTVLEASLETLRFAIKDSGAKFTRERLPTVRVDPAQMELVWRNLIGNALKFQGKKRLHIEIGAVLRGDTWLFSVRDNGIGLDAKEAERIFTLFQRLHPRGIYPGTGIGLALCKRIVERHGGRIWAESELGEGATFTFTLPA